MDPEGWIRTDKQDELKDEGVGPRLTRHHKATYTSHPPRYPSDPWGWDGGAEPGALRGCSAPPARTHGGDPRREQEGATAPPPAGQGPPGHGDPPVPTGAPASPLMEKAPPPFNGAGKVRPGQGPMSCRGRGHPTGINGAVEAWPSCSANELQGVWPRNCIPRPPAQGTRGRGGGVPQVRAWGRGPPGPL